MHVTKTIKRTAILIVCCAACSVFGAKPTMIKALSRTNSKTPVKTRLMIRKSETETSSSRMTLMGRDGDILLVQDTRAGSGLTRLNKAQIVQCEFDIEYDRSAVATALRKHDWAAAVRILSPVVRLVLPYLDITDNDGLEPAMDLGTYMMASADREMRTSSGKESGRELAFKQYNAAYKLFTLAAKANWTPIGEVAHLKGCRALIAQGKESQATEILEEITSPYPDDAAYGHYWLVQAELFNSAGKTREALDAVVKSVVFANKDVETFPAALLLSADCYVKLDQHHRARDLYYEVAILFVGTDWAADALIGLAAVMESKKTVEEEKSPIENVFFNIADDMNKLSEELLKERVTSEPGADTEDDAKDDTNENEKNSAKKDL